jgi:hypothetical protein
MLLRATILLVTFWSTAPKPPAKIHLNGTAQLCPDDDARTDSIGVAGVKIFAFDATKAQKALSSLYTLDNISWDTDGVQAMRAFNAEFLNLKDVLRRTPKLATATTSTGGQFQIVVPNVDSVLVFAEADIDDSPFFFASKVVSTKGHADLNVVLPMCNKRVQ